MQINGKELAVEIAGDGPVVLMVHGLGATSNFYQVQADALTDGHTVIRVDSAGAGRSEVSDDISVDAHADDLAGAARRARGRLRGRGGALDGHPRGPLARRPLPRARSPRSPCSAPSPSRPTPGRQAQRDRAAVLREKGTVAVAPGVVANALSETTRRDKPEVAAFVRELVMRQDPEGYARNCEALAAATDPGPISTSLPLLLVTGSDDKVGPPAVSHELAESHGSATVQIIEGIGHWTALEAANDVTDHLLKFL